MATVKIFRDLSKGDSEGESVEVSVGPVRAVLLDQADKSDPLNDVIVASMRIGTRFAIKTQESSGGSAEALSALVAAVIQHYAEIRDAIALDGAG